MAALRKLPKPDKTKILKFTPHWPKKRHGSEYVKKGLATKLTEDQARAILVLKPETSPYHEKAIALSQLINIPSSTIHNIWSGRTWKHLSR